MAQLMELFRKLFRSRLKARHLARMSPAEAFEAIYRRNAWKGTDSVSGLGSDLTQTAAISAALPGLLKKLGARSMLDIPCGDFFWMQHVDLGEIDYIGAEIVDDLVAANKIHENGRRRFVRCDLLEDKLPSADVVFCRDCLVHFSIPHVWQALSSIAASEAKYLVTTTFTSRDNSRQIVTGQWRPLNLQAQPFSLPEPLMMIDEQCTQDEGQYPDKMLAVWPVEQLRAMLVARAQP